MPDVESAVRAQPLVEAGARGNEIMCIRYMESHRYYYGELYPGVKPNLVGRAME